jgi:hypothetical protein
VWSVGVVLLPVLYLYCGQSQFGESVKSAQHNNTTHHLITSSHLTLHPALLPSTATMIDLLLPTLRSRRGRAVAWASRCLIRLPTSPQQCASCRWHSSSSSSSRSSSTSLPSSSLPDYFALLHVERSTPLSSVKASYYSLALQYHPDRTGGLSPSVQQWTDQRFALLTTAWQTLSDPTKRRLYEQSLDLGAIGDRERLQHWVQRHRPPERLDAPPHVQDELEQARKKSAEDGG